MELSTLDLQQLASGISFCRDAVRGVPDHPKIFAPIGSLADVEVEIIEKVEGCSCAMTYREQIKDSFFRYCPKFYAVQVLAANFTGLTHIPRKLYLSLPTQPREGVAAYQQCESKWDKWIETLLLETGEAIDDSKKQKIKESENGFATSLCKNTGIDLITGLNFIQQMLGSSRTSQPPAKIPRLQESQNDVHQVVRRPLTSERLGEISLNYKEIQFDSNGNAMVSICSAGPQQLIVMRKNQLFKTDLKSKGSEIVRKYEGNSVLAGNENYFAVSSQGATSIWNTRTMQPYPTDKFAHAADNLQSAELRFVGSYNWLAMGGKKGDVRVHNIEKLSTTKYLGATSAANYAIHCTETHVGVGASSGTMWIWDAANPGKPIANFKKSSRKTIVSLDHLKSQPNEWASVSKSGSVHIHNLISIIDVATHNDSQNEWRSVRWLEEKLLELVSAKGVFWLDLRQTQNYVQSWEVPNTVTISPSKHIITKACYLSDRPERALLLQPISQRVTKKVALLHLFAQGRQPEIL